MSKNNKPFINGSLVEDSDEASIEADSADWEDEDTNSGVELPMGAFTREEGEGIVLGKVQKINPAQIIDRSNVVGSWKDSLENKASRERMGSTELVQGIKGESRIAFPFMRKHRLKIFALLGSLMTAGGFAAVLNSNRANSLEDPISEGPEDALLASLPSDGECVEDETPCEASPDKATTLYGQVENVVRSQEAVSTYSPNQEIRLTAASTHQLMKEHFSEAHTWEDLDGRWKDSTRAFDLTVKKLDAWGYDEALDRLETSSTPITTIDGMLEFIANDGYFKHSEKVARNIAVEIAMIKDPRIASDVSIVEADLEAISPEEIESAIEDFIETPPPVPPLYTSPSMNGDGIAALYDAPEPMNLKTAKTAEITPVANPIKVESKFSQIGPYEVPEPLYVRPVVEEEPEELQLDEELYEVPEPHFVKTVEDKLMEAFFKEGDAMNPVAAHAIEPEKTFTQKAAASVKGWASKLGKWFK